MRRSRRRRPLSSPVRRPRARAFSAQRGSAASARPGRAPIATIGRESPRKGTPSTYATTARWPRPGSWRKKPGPVPSAASTSAKSKGATRCSVRRVTQASTGGAAKSTRDPYTIRTTLSGCAPRDVLWVTLLGLLLRLLRLLPQEQGVATVVTTRTTQSRTPFVLLCGYEDGPTTTPIPLRPVMRYI